MGSAKRGVIVLALAVLVVGAAIILADLLADRDRLTLMRSTVVVLY